MNSSIVLTHLSINPMSGEPIYKQLVSQIERLLSSGKVDDGTWLPSVRQLAEALDVNPMTISKAYSLLEVHGMVTRERGKGMKVTTQQRAVSQAERLAKLTPLLENLKEQSSQLGIENQQLLQWLQKQLSINK